jgi:perosamine synthetase
MHMGLAALGIGPGDEVILADTNWIASAAPITYLGATPVFVDVEPETLCLDIEKVKLALTSKTRAIMLVSSNGRYPKIGITAFEELARERNLLLIEDAAQSLGSFYPDGRHIGRAGIVGSFSFSAPKIISTGQGGALITDDDAIANKLRRLKDFGRSGGGNDIHDSIGYNFKFTELQACIGIEQMKKLPARVGRKKEIWHHYAQQLLNVTGIKLFEHNLNFTTPWFIDSLVEKRDAFASSMKSKGIGTRVMYPPINKQKAYQENGEHFVSNVVGDNGLWLPSSVQLTNEEINRICDEIKGILREEK